MPDRFRLPRLSDRSGHRARRKVHALIFTAVYSRHMFVWLTYSQSLAVVTEADPANPRLSRG